MFDKIAYYVQQVQMIQNVKSQVRQNSTSVKTKKDKKDKIEIKGEHEPLAVYDLKLIEQVQGEVSAQYVELQKLIHDYIISQSDAFSSDEEPNEYWSSEETGKRILILARKIATGHPQRVKVLRHLVKESFEETAQVLGGLLEVTQQTYEILMREFERWESEGVF